MERYGYCLFIVIGVCCFVISVKQFKGAASLVAMTSAAITIIYSLVQLQSV